MDRMDLIELTEAEVAFALAIILRSDSHAIPIMKGKGSTKDCTIRDAMMQAFAERLARHLCQHLRCFRSPAAPSHSAGDGPRD